MLKNNSIIGQKHGEPLTLAQLKKSPVTNLPYVTTFNQEIYIAAMAHCKAAHRTELLELIPLSEQTDEFWHEVIRKNPYAIAALTQPSDELCFLAIQSADKRNIDYVYPLIPNPSLEVQKLALNKDGEILKYINEQTDELCLIAVQQTGRALKYVKHKTSEICMAAVQTYGFALSDLKVEDRTPELCLAAVKQEGYALRYVPYQTDELCLAAVKATGEALKLVNCQTPEICMAAVQSDDINIFQIPLKFVKEQTYELCLAAVKHYGSSLQYVKEKTDEICLAAIQQDGWAIRYVPIQHPDWCMLAVQKKGRALCYINEQTPELCLAAVQQDGEALNSVKNQTEEICRAAIAQTTKAHALVRDELLRAKLQKKIAKSAKVLPTMQRQFKPQNLIASDFIDQQIHIRLDHQKIIDTIHQSWWQNRYQPDTYWQQWVDIMNGDSQNIKILDYVNHDAAFLQDSAVFALDEFNLYHYIRLLRAFNLSLFTVKLTATQQSQLHVQEIDIFCFVKALQQLNTSMDDEFIISHILSHADSSATQLLLNMQNIEVFISQNFDFIDKQSQNLNQAKFRQGFKQVCQKLPNLQLYIEDLLQVFQKQPTIKKHLQQWLTDLLAESNNV